MTTKLLEQIRAQAQQEVADRHNAMEHKAHESQWVIHTLRHSLPREQIALAHRLIEMDNCARMVGVSATERVDGGNGQARRQDAACDAQRALYAYAQAVSSRWGHGKAGDRAAACIFTIAAGDTAQDVMRVLGYASGSWRSMVRFVQVTMQHCQDYDDEIATERLTHKAKLGSKMASSEFAPARSP